MNQPSSPKGPSVMSLVLVPAILAMLVTAARLVGELSGWGDLLAPTDAPGTKVDGKDKFQGLLGIAWLVPLFGIYFGFRLRKAHGGPGALRVLGMAIVGVGVTFLTIGVFEWLGMAKIFSADDPTKMEGLLYALVGLVVGTLVACFGWGRLALVLFVYGILSRIPVIVVTALSVWMGWDTHYAKLPVGMPDMEGNALILQLCAPQVTFWIAYSVVAGLIFGALGAAIAGKKPES